MKNNLKKGFTLIELLVVIAIIAILAAILIPGLNDVTRTAYRTESRANLSTIGKALFMFTNDNNFNLPKVYRSQRATIEGTDPKNGHLAKVLAPYTTTDFNALSNTKKVNPAFVDQAFAKAIGAGSKKTLQGFLDANRSFYRYAANRYDVGGEPYPWAQTSQNYVRSVGDIQAPGETWALTDADLVLGGVWTTLQNPVHGDRRVTLYFDSSVRDTPTDPALFDYGTGY